VGRVHFFFIWVGDGLGARENFCSWVFFGEVFRSLGGGLGCGLGYLKETAISKKKESADEDETADDESYEKISRGASASHGDLVDVLEVTFLGFAEGDGEPLFRLFGGFASMGGDNL
jgi:hypothetical protein